MRSSVAGLQLTNRYLEGMPVPCAVSVLAETL
jgi:hypothetical protein